MDSDKIGITMMAAVASEASPIRSIIINNQPKGGDIANSAVLNSSRTVCMMAFDLGGMHMHITRVPRGLIHVACLGSFCQSCARPDGTPPRLSPGARHPTRESRQGFC
jgi:hypothetical protein